MLYGVLRRFTAFYGILRQIGDDRERATKKSSEQVTKEMSTKPQTTTAIVTSFPPWHCCWRLHRSEGWGDCGILEDCGRWLMSITHDDTPPSNRCRSIWISSSRSRGLGRGEGGESSAPDVEATIPLRKPPGGNTPMTNDNVKGCRR